MQSVKRAIVYPKDIQRITGKGERYSRHLAAQIKKHYKKQQHQLITIRELCTYLGIQQEDIEHLIV